MGGQKKAEEKALDFNRTLKSDKTMQKRPPAAIRREGRAEVTRQERKRVGVVPVH